MSLVSCPECGATNVYRRVEKDEYECLRCGHKWPVEHKWVWLAGKKYRCVRCGMEKEFEESPIKPPFKAPPRGRQLKKTVKVMYRGVEVEVPETEEMKRIREEIEAKKLEKKFYYCDNPRHPHGDIVQVLTYEKDPKCPLCGRVMTYGKYWT